MERDFLGMSGKESVISAKEEAGGGRQDSVFRDNQVVQWPFSSKRSALKQFMTYNIGQEERAKLVYNQLASSGFQPITTNDAFEASRRASPVEGQQKCFAPDRQGVHPFPMHLFQSQSNASPAIPMHRIKPINLSQMGTHNSIHVAPSSPPFTFHGSHNSPNVPEHNSPNVPVSSFKQQLRGGGILSNTPAAGSTVGGAAGSTVGGLTPRNLTKHPPMTAQLTMFYAGSVCVYDDMPSDTAQALMYLASKGSNASSNALNPKPVAPSPSNVKGARVGFLSDIETQTKSQTQIQMVTQNQTQTVTQNQTQTPVASPLLGTPSAMSTTSHIVSQTGGGSIATTVLVGAKSIGTSSTTNHNEHSKTTTAASGSTAPVSVMPRAIPQARKASLARFLEKRKERVVSVAPYSCTKNDVNDTTESDCQSSKSSPNEGALMNNKEGLWNLGSQKKIGTDGGEYPSTKLHM